MKVKIEYYYSKAESESNPYWCKSEVNDQWVCSCGTSWDEAKARHIQKLSDKIHEPEAPIAEEIDI